MRNHPGLEKPKFADRHPVLMPTAAMLACGAIVFGAGSVSKDLANGPSPSPAAPEMPITHETPAQLREDSIVKAAVTKQIKSIRKIYHPKGSPVTECSEVSPAQIQCVTVIGKLVDQYSFSLGKHDAPKQPETPTSPNISLRE